FCFFFFSSRRRHTRSDRDWSSDVCSSDLLVALDRCCKQVGRDPATVRRSVMTSYLIGRDRSDLLERARQVREVIPSLGSMSPEEVLENRKDAWLVGKPAEIAARIRDLSRLGIELFMLQHFLLDDSDALELLGKEVLPAVA